MGDRDYSIFDLGDFELVSGEILPSGFLAYKAFGDPKNPALIYPTWFGGRKRFSETKHHDESMKRVSLADHHAQPLRTMPLS